MFARQQQGLTLLEVLVALVIIAIALTAVIKATAENIRSTAYLREKTIATWVGLSLLNKARLELIPFPQSPEKREGKELSFQQNWAWQGFLEKTPNPHIYEVHVKIFHQPEQRFITELTGYLYAA